jgi:PAS domain S-box-containing protein
MQTFFQAQLDFVYFFYGLAFVFLGIVCFLIKRQYKFGPPWQWLGWFGILHGFNEWADMVNLIIINQDWFTIPRLFLLTISFLCLVEFARQDFNNRKKIQISRWIYWFVGLILFFGWWNWELFGVNIFVRYLLGAGGALATGFAFLRFSHLSKEYKIKFYIGAVSLWLYGLTQLIIPSGQLPLIKFTNQEIFSDYFGFPIQLVRAFLAISVSVCVWLYYQRSVYQEFKEQQIASIKMIRSQLMLVFFGILVLGWLVSNSLGIYAKRELVINNENVIEVLSGSLNALLTDAKDLSKILSGSPNIINYLKKSNKENLASANAVLDRYSAIEHVAVAYILDKDGTTVATSNRFAPDSLQGINYSFRPYFKGAIAGSPTILFAIGVTTKKPGFYSSYPVKDDQGQIIGVAVVKMNLNLIQKYFDRYGLAFLVSPDGVLFMSGNSEYHLQVLSPISHLEKRHLYSLRQFDAARLEPLFGTSPKNGEIFIFKDKFFLASIKKINIDNWSIVFLSQTIVIGLYRLFGIVITLVFCILTTGFVILAQDIRRNSALTYFASIVYSSDDAIIGLNLKNEIISWNTGAEKVYGYDKNEILGKNFSVLIPKDKLEENIKILEQANLGKPSEHFDTIHLKKTGQLINVSLTVSPTKNTVGDIIGTSLMIRDTSKEKMIEEAVKRSEKKFVDLFNNINDIVFISDLNGNFLDFNETMIRDLGYTKQELKSMNRQDIVTAEFAKLIKDRLREIAREGFKKFETMFVTKNGITIPVEISSNIIFFEGKKAILSSARDITDRKLADAALKKQMTELEKFKLVAENSSDAIVITDVDGHILYANAASEKLSGFSRQDIDSHNIGRLWGGHMEKNFYENMWKIIKVEKKIFVGELKNRRKTGEEYYVSARFYPLLDKSGEVQFFVGMETDITKAKEVDRAKSEFISVASHQLRTPLTGIKWFSELLLKGKAGDLSVEQKDFIKQVYDSNDRMIKLVDDLLDVSHIEEAGRFRIILKPEEFSAIIKGLVEEQKIQAKNKNVKIRLGAGCLKKIVLRLDKNKIEQALQNLLSNAIKYSPVGGEVLIDCEAKEGEFVCSFKDSGVGIPDYQQHRVFEKFFRADNVITVGSGTGLGLYIAKFIIQGHDGKIWFKSKENKGTTFYFSLPIKK